MELAGLARVLQYTGAMILFGVPAFFLYSLPSTFRKAAWIKPLLLSNATMIGLGAILFLIVQTANMTDVPIQNIDLSSIAMVITDTHLGQVMAARVFLIILAMALIVSDARWLGLVVTSAAILTSFAFTGHGNADDDLSGIIHLVGDVLHLFAAATWIGALVALSLLLRIPPSHDIPLCQALFSSLQNFSGIGTGLVSIILLTGLINSYFLIGTEHLGSFYRSNYGLLLLVKMALFLFMLGSAALNRFILTPSLGKALGNTHDIPSALKALRHNLFVETGVSLMVLALISIIGMMDPLAGQ
jgi:putative copper resistance protein D